MFQQNISTDDSIYYNHFQKRAMERGEGWVEVPFVPPGWNLRATISQGKDKNFPEWLLDLGFFRLPRFSPRAS